MISERSSDEYTTINQSRLNNNTVNDKTSGKESSLNHDEMERMRVKVQEAYKVLKAKRIAAKLQ